MGTNYCYETRDAVSLNSIENFGFLPDGLPSRYDHANQERMTKKTTYERNASVFRKLKPAASDIQKKRFSLFNDSRYRHIGKMQTM
jgi:hypothetical protein